ncbi:hypothetical protein DL96DRAFT_534667 [Flagelloscypha sp. PMI_526]|nr:hypothetical protein DL96DRAFT_534667 [Flagelloscypha sp. PMI_526]
MVVDTTQFMREDEVFLIQKEELDAIMALFPDIGDLIRTLTLFHFTTLNISHWITNPSLFDVAKLCAFLSNCSRLETFSISRPFGYSMGSTGNRVLWDTLGMDLQKAIRQVTKLPTLKDLRIHDHMVFETTQSFCDQFAFDDKSSIVHLELACIYFLKTQLPRSVTGRPASLKTLKLGYVGGPFMPFTLLSAASPFEISQLESLELVGIAPLDDDWMTGILDAQKSSTTLKRLELIGVEGSLSFFCLESSLI